MAIADTWLIKIASDSQPLELRAIKASKILIRHFYPKDFTSTDAICLAFEKAALELNARDFNIYYVFNPIRDDAVIAEGKACKSSDIAFRDLLLIDIDRRDKKHPSTGETCPASDDELVMLESVCDDVAAYLKRKFGEIPIAKVMSGNGYHLYYDLDLPNDSQSTRVVKELLRTLENLFGTDTCEIDTGVFDAPRITKVLGCIARKGTASGDRPYREVKLCL